MSALLINQVIGFSLIAFFFPAIAVFVVLRHRPNQLNWVFAAYLTSIAWWAFFSIFMITADNRELGLFWDRMCLSGTVWIPSTFFHFVMVYAKKMGSTLLVKINYSISAIFLFFLWLTPLVVRDVSPSYGVNYWTVAGSLYLLFICFFLECAVAGIIRLWVFYNELENAEEKRQTLILFWFSVIGYAGGSCEYLLSYQIRLPGVAELSNYCVFLLGISITYLIFRYRFLEIEDVLAIHRDKLALIGLLASSINHEIKNPTFLAREMVNKAEKVLTEGRSQDAAELVRRIGGQVSRIERIVERLHDFYKPIHTNRLENNQANVSVQEAIENALFFVAQELKYQNIELRLSIDPDLPKLKGDKTQFEEIFLNLIVNAYHAMSPPDSTRVGDDRSLSPLGSEAMPKGGKLMIEARTVSKNVGARRPRPNKEGWETQPLRTTSGAVVITISDTGHGIPKEDLKNIFKPFYTTKGKSGTGLGLHIVKTLVEQNGGNISVESDIDKKTLFRLSFNRRSSVTLQVVK